MEKLGGRKFLATMACVVIGSAIELTKPGGISMAYATMIGAVVAAFGAANAWVTTNSQPDSPPQPPPGPSHEDLQAVHQNMALLIEKVEQASATALKAGDLATSVGQQIGEVSKLARVAIKVNQ